jgi:hypothetical protein
MAMPVITPPEKAPMRKLWDAHKTSARSFNFKTFLRSLLL